MLIGNWLAHVIVNDFDNVAGNVAGADVDDDDASGR